MSHQGLRHVRCTAGESVFEACRVHFGPGYTVVAGPGRRSPTALGMVGTVSVRDGEVFAVVPIRQQAR